MTNTLAQRRASPEPWVYVGLHFRSGVLGIICRSCALEPKALTRKIRKLLHASHEPKGLNSEQKTTLNPTVSPKKLETGLRAVSAGIPYTLLL